MARRLANLNPYELHKYLINEYVLTNPGATKLLQRDTSRDKTDHDVIRENHRFLWEGESVDSWEKQLAKKYYDKLFKEYCIADLSRYKENKVAMRWRIEKEVVVGKGQFICGGRICEERDALRSWEVNFAYSEHGTKKNALVKLRLCPKCSDKLNYHSKKREVKRMKRRERNRKVVKPITEGTCSPREERVKSIGNEQVDHNADSQECISESGPSDQSRENYIPPESAAMEECWTKGPDVEEKSREQEFDDYLEDLLL
ncbi:protein FRA10AC1 homolog [Toxorhynchites rutilus septentrionalis]|uniref:protein FRA10AC1 homolog n=1 Tax=Toxorhynchites rutilus septentrionalis TaxID=329112 RepID=UPI002479E84A|nr:protein FRA10AC1 homolog [Toxorhynchites rutilus septentrionalis]